MKARNLRSKVTWSIVAAFLVTGCASKGLLTEEAPVGIAEIANQIPDNGLQENPRFIIYGDNRPGWRGKTKFLSRSAWLTWWQLLVPFYQVYLLGNGAVGGVNRLRSVPDCGHKEAEWVRDAVYAEAQRSNVDFIINSGDIVTDGRRPDHWMHFIRQNKMEVPLVVDYPYLPVIGNHEKANDPEYGMPNYQAVFSQPAFYAVHCRDVDIFVLDSNMLIDQYGFIDDGTQEELFSRWFVADTGAEPAWLERELAASEKTFKIVCLHHPLYSFGKHATDWDNPDFGRNLHEKRRLLVQLFKDEGVQVVLAGHDHLYERKLLRYQAPDGTKREMHFIVSGGGGTPLYRGGSEKKVAALEASYAGVQLIKQEVAYNYCLVDAGRRSVEVKVFKVTGDPDTPVWLLDTVRMDKYGVRTMPAGTGPLDGKVEK